MLIKTLIGLGVAIGGLCLYVALQPPEFSIARELTINASAEALFPYINNSKKSYEWMPWREADPDAQMNYSGPEEGVGAKTTWDSNGQMGTGEALVVESIPNLSVKTQLTYTRPMNMSQMAEVSLTPTANGTVVRWSVSGHNTFLGRLMCVFLSMDKMVGGQFEKGLANLKALVEGK